MSYVTQEDVFQTIEPVLRGVFEEFADFTGTKRPVTRRPVPAHPLCRVDAEIRHRQAGPAQPARDHRRHRRLRPRGRDLPRLQGRDREGRRGARHPRAEVADQAAQLLRQAERLGAGAGRAGPRLRRVRGRRRQGPDRQVPARRAPRPRCARRPAPRTATRCSSSPTRRPRPPSWPASPRTKIGAGAGADRPGPLRVLLDRRLPDVRAQRGDRADRLQPQPVLDAAGRAGGAGDAGPADHQRVPVRHRLQRRRAVLGRDPEPSAGDHDQGLRDRRLRPQRASRPSSAAC